MYLVISQAAAIVLHGKIGGENGLRQRHIDIFPGAFAWSFSVFDKKLTIMSMSKCNIKKLT